MIAWTALIGRHEENALLDSLQPAGVAPTPSLPLAPVVSLLPLVSLVVCVCPLRVVAVLAVGVEQATTKGEVAHSWPLARPKNHWNSMTQECPLFLPLLVWK